MAHAAGLPVEIYGRFGEGAPLEESVRETHRAQRRDFTHHIHETYSFETVVRHLLSVV